MTVNIQRATVADKPHVVQLLASQLHEHQIDVPPATLARAVDSILEVAARLYERQGFRRLARTRFVLRL